MEINLNSEARTFAIKHHHPLQKYGEHDYVYHLDLVVVRINQFIDDLLKQDWAYEYRHHIFELRKELNNAGYLHDLGEDSFTNYGDIKTSFGEFVANIVYACTNEKGKTRSARRNDKFYLELAEQEFATFVKLCDNIVNMEFSQQTGSSMFQKYLSERDDLIRKATNFKRALSAIELYLTNEAGKELLNFNRKSVDA